MYPSLLTLRAHGCLDGALAELGGGDALGVPAALLEVLAHDVADLALGDACCGYLAQRVSPLGL